MSPHFGKRYLLHEQFNFVSALPTRQVGVENSDKVRPPPLLTHRPHPWDYPPDYAEYIILQIHSVTGGEIQESGYLPCLVYYAYL